MKSEASPATKATDKQLAKVQTLLLDSLAPLLGCKSETNARAKQDWNAIKAARLLYNLHPVWERLTACGSSFPLRLSCNIIAGSVSDSVFLKEIETRVRYVGIRQLVKSKLDNVEFTVEPPRVSKMMLNVT